MRRPNHFRSRCRLVVSGAILAAALISPGLAEARKPPSAQPLDMPDRYSAADGPARAQTDAPWWSSFHDGELNRIVEEGLGDNYDVKSAQSRIDEADAVVTQQLAPLLPTVTWDTQGSMAPTETLGFQFGGIGAGGMMGPEPDPLYFTWSTALNARIDIDLSGRNVEAKRAAEHDAAAAEAELDAQRVALAGQIVNAYYDVVAAKQQLAAVQRQVSIAEQLLEVTELRFENGQANAVEVLQQKQQVASAQTLEPPAEATVKAYQQRLAVLLAENPGTQYATPDELPEVGPAPALGSPDDLMRNRPELRAAQERLEGSRSRRKNANRQFAPTLSITGALGYQGFYLDSNAPGSEPHRHQGFWNAGALLSVPLFQGGRNVGGVQKARAAENTAMYSLNQSTLRAVQEVEEAIVNEEGQRKAVAAWERNFESAKEAYEESRNRYAAGVGDYLSVLAAFDAARAAELNLINARRQLISARVRLYTALGDNWRDQVTAGRRTEATAN